MRALAFLAVCQVASGAALEVPGDFATLQEACDAAADGDRILVHPGEYALTEPIDFNRLHRPDDPFSPPFKNISLLSYSGPERTTLRWSNESGNPEAVALFVFTNGEDRSSKVEGFTIDGGYGTYDGRTASPSHVSAIYCSHSSAAFRDLRIVSCGEPAVVLEDSSSTFSACTIARNRFGGVSAREGSRPRFEGCTIDANEAGDEGAGIDAELSTVTLLGCQITRNKAARDESGGGIACSDGALILEGCTLMANLGWGGGALYLWESQAVLTNCVLAGNRSLQGGGAVRIGHGASLSMTNCTIANNTATFEGTVVCDDGDPSAAAFTNCIFWANEPPGSCGGSPACACGLLSFSSTGQDPRFVREGVFDFTRPFPDFVVDAGVYSLRGDSPCIDAGTSAGAPSRDIDGVPRPCDSGVDQGAHEFCSRAFHRGDANGDGQIDIGDPIFILSWLWGDPWSPWWCYDAWDANDDGRINIADPVRTLSTLFAGAGPLPSPYPDCGWDETPDALTCRESTACP